MNLLIPVYDQSAKYVHDRHLLEINFGIDKKPGMTAFKYFWSQSCRDNLNQDFDDYKKSFFDKNVSY